jgi:hypothetical protein
MTSHVTPSLGRTALVTIWTTTVAVALVGGTSLQAVADAGRESPAESPTRQAPAEASETAVSAGDSPVVSPSGIDAQVWIGQGCPGPSGPDPECSKRLSELTISVLDASGYVMCQIHPDGDGRFRVELPAGTYTVHPELGPWINAPEQTVTVDAGQLARIRVVYVSGIR